MLPQSLWRRVSRMTASANHWSHSHASLNHRGMF
jgi:hypothetical protein